MNKTVKKKNQIPSLSMLKLTWIENAFPCHNCDTPVTQLWHTRVNCWQEGVKVEPEIMENTTTLTLLADSAPPYEISL